MDLFGSLIQILRNINLKYQLILLEDRMMTGSNLNKDESRAPLKRYKWHSQKYDYYHFDKQKYCVFLITPSKDLKSNLIFNSILIVSIFLKHSIF